MNTQVKLKRKILNYISNMTELIHDIYNNSILIIYYAKCIN